MQSPSSKHDVEISASGNNPSVACTNSKSPQSNQPQQSNGLEGGHNKAQRVLHDWPTHHSLTSSVLELDQRGSRQAPEWGREVVWSGYHTSVTSHFRNVPKKRTAWAMGGAGRKRGTLRSSQLRVSTLLLAWNCVP